MTARTTPCFVFEDIGFSERVFDLQFGCRAETMPKVVGQECSFAKEDATEKRKHGDGDEVESSSQHEAECKSGKGASEPHHGYFGLLPPDLFATLWG